MDNFFELGPKSTEFSKSALDHVWHPCTQMRDHEQMPLVPIAKGDGVYLEDFDGRRYIDGISSWWVNLFGHVNPYINQQIANQLKKLEHVILAGFTHESVVTLSRRLVAKAKHLKPDSTQPLTRCFYADNGSSAVEVALKMSFHACRNRGQAGKTRFVSLSNSYHGETLGALAVSDVGLYKETYGPLLLEPIVMPTPDCYYRGELDWQSHSEQAFKPMEELLAEQHGSICAVIVEPLVQCAGGMRMYHPKYLQLLRAACDDYGVDLIADEIAVGFGRTGTFFACEQASIVPDFLCLSKGLTGGYLPLSVVMTTEKMYRHFYDRYETMKAFLHSHSYTGNPLACAAALATLDLFEQSDVLGQNKILAEQIKNGLAQLNDHPNISEVRQTGMIAAVEMVQHKNDRIPFPWQQRRGLIVYKYGLQQGCLLRPLGGVSYIMPPYVITPTQLDHLMNTLIEGVDRATRA